MESRTKRRIVSFYILASVHLTGERHQRKVEEAEEEKDPELREMTEVRQEVEIEGGRNPIIVVGDSNLHTNPETGLRG